MEIALFDNVKLTFILLFTVSPWHCHVLYGLPPSLLPADAGICLFRVRQTTISKSSHQNLIYLLNLTLCSFYAPLDRRLKAIPRQ